MKYFYAILATLILGGYATAAITGREFRVTKQQKISQKPGVRGASGGGVFYRGYQGGK